MSDTSTAPVGIFRAAIPRLHSARDFPPWKSQIKPHLQQHGLWAVLSGATPRPRSTPTPAQHSWDSASEAGTAFLRQYVDDDIYRTFPASETAPEMWAALVRRYDEWCAGAVVAAFKAVSAMRFEENSGQSLLQYLGAFERAWAELEIYTADAEQRAVGTGNSLQTVMRGFAASEDAKIEFLIGSLPESLCGMAKEMRVLLGERASFVEVRDFLVRVHAHRQRKVAQAAEEVRRRVCSWCRSRGLESAGHGAGDCDRLQEFRLEGGRREKEQKRRRQDV